MQHKIQYKGGSQQDHDLDAKAYPKRQMPGHFFQQVYQEVGHDQADAEYHKYAQYDHGCNVYIKRRCVAVYIIVVKPVKVNACVDEGPEKRDGQYHFNAVTACNIKWYANLYFQR